MRRPLGEVLRRAGALVPREWTPPLVVTSATCATTFAVLAETAERTLCR
jgi:hypothetical protein